MAPLPLDTPSGFFEMATRVNLVTHLPRAGAMLASFLSRQRILDHLIVQTPPAKMPGKSWLRSQLSDFYCWATRGPEVLFPLSLSGHEKEALFESVERRISGSVLFTEDINRDPKVLDALKASEANLTLVLGGRILSPDVLNSFRGVWVNGHGGLLPHYRGLDSELAAILDRRADLVGVTIHELSEKVDFGRIFLLSPMLPSQGETVASVRWRNHINLFETYVEFLGLLSSVDFQLGRLREVDVDWSTSKYVSTLRKRCSSRMVYGND